MFTLKFKATKWKRVIICSKKKHTCCHYSRFYCCWAPRRVTGFQNGCHCRNMWTRDRCTGYYVVIKWSVHGVFSCYRWPCCQNIHPWCCNIRLQFKRVNRYKYFNFDILLYFLEAVFWIIDFGLELYYET